MERGWIIHHFPPVLSILLLMMLKLPDVHHVIHHHPCLLFLFHKEDSILPFVRVFLVLLPLPSSVSLFSRHCPPWTITSTFSPFTVLQYTSKFTSKIFPKSWARYIPTFSGFGKIFVSMLGDEFILPSRHFGGQPSSISETCSVVFFMKPRWKLLWPLCQETIFLLALFLALCLSWKQIC